MLFPFMNPMMLHNPGPLVSPWTLFAGDISAGRYEVFNGAQLCRQNPGLIAGTTYDFSFDYDRDVSGGNPKLRVNCGATNGSNTVFVSGILPSGPGSLSGSFVAPVGAPYFGIEAENALYSGRLDNVVLTTGGGPNLIQDGTFDIPNP